MFDKLSEHPQIHVAGVCGAPARTLVVRADPVALERHVLTFEQLSDTVRAALPADMAVRLTVDDQRSELRAVFLDLLWQGEQRLGPPDDLMHRPVGTNPGVPLAAVAELRMVATEQTTSASEPYLSFELRTPLGSQAVRKYLAGLERDLGLQLSFTSDATDCSH